MAVPTRLTLKKYTLTVPILVTPFIQVPETILSLKLPEDSMYISHETSGNDVHFYFMVDPTLPDVTMRILVMGEGEKTQRELASVFGMAQLSMGKRFLFELE